jgi:hypothetical protein
VLADTLGQGRLGIEATSIRDVGGDTGTTDRRRISVEWNLAGREAGLPSDLFVKSTPLSAKNRTMVAALAMAKNEVLFHEWASAALPPGMAPVVQLAHAGQGARHLILMEDPLDTDPAAT